MFAIEYDVKKVYMGRLEHGDDLLESLQKFVEDKGIKMGIIQVIGAAQRATLGFYDGNRKVYEKIEIEDELEIAGGWGNISLKDGKPMVHLHVVVSNREGRAFGGHVFEGTKVFACEFIIKHLEGPVLERALDDVTGLTLWKQT